MTTAAKLTVTVAAVLAALIIAVELLAPGTLPPLPQIKSVDQMLDRVLDAWQNNTEAVTGWVTTYQTLLAGLIAFGGAVLAYRGVQRQIAQAKSQEARRREREHFAARAVLPAALGALSSYAETCIVRLYELLPDYDDRDTVTESLGDVPPVPQGIFEQIRDAVREAADENVQEALANLLAGLQVQHARLQGLTNDQARHGKIRVDRVCGGIVDAATLRAGAGRSFDYARRRSENVDLTISADDVRSQLIPSSLFNDQRIARAVSGWRFETSVFGSAIRIDGSAPMRTA